MFDFMLDTKEQPADADAKEVDSYAMAQPVYYAQPCWGTPRAACIYGCGTEAEQLEKYGTLMSLRNQKYICWSCMNKFNIMTAEDRNRSGR